MENKAVEDLKTHLRCLSDNDKEEIWAWLDGHIEAIDELIECVDQEEE